MSHPLRLLLAAGLLLASGTPALANNYVVTNNGDTGAGSLRKAISDANGHSGPDTITFMLAPGSTTIKPQSALPPILGGGLDITGQTGANGGPVVEIDGSDAGDVSGLTVAGGPTAIRRLVINRFADRGIYAGNMSGLTVESCRIGTNVAGDTDMGNGAEGIFLSNVTTATIGGPDAADGNQISGNDGDGLGVGGGTGVTVQRNLIGTDASGTAALGNGGDGVRLFADTNAIGTAGAGNVISGNAGRGVTLDGAANVVLGNLIGLAATGTAKLANEKEGVLVTAADNTIGGTGLGARNVISGNKQGGIFASAGATGLSVVGNYVGTDATGTKGLGNGQTGITIAAAGAKIGGTVNKRNVVSGNGAGGILLTKTAANAVVRANYVGTNASGDAAIGNTGAGISVAASFATIGGAGLGNVVSGNARGLFVDGNANEIVGNFVGTNAAGKAALGNTQEGMFITGDGNTIGGATAALGNVVAGNAFDGIFLGAASSRTVVTFNVVGVDVLQSTVLGNGYAGIRVDGIGNTVGAPSAGNLIGGNSRGIYVNGKETLVQGNAVGVSPSTGTALPNDEEGILVLAPDATIGGPAAGEGNVVGANKGNGIRVGGGAAVGATIQGNRVGVLQNGTSRPNHAGEIVLYQAFDALVGGPGAGEGNVVAHSDFVGVLAIGGEHHSILGNAIFDSAFADIDLQPTLGPTANDPLDADLGTNARQNFPVLSDVVFASGAMQVKGALDSTPSSAFRVELFSDAQCHPTGMGGGDTYLGSVDVITDAVGRATIDTAVPAAAAPYVTATATSADGSTSEFSPCALAGGPNPGRFQFGQPYFLAYEEKPQVLITVTRSDGVLGTATVTYETVDDSAAAPGDFTATTGVLTFAPGEVIKTFAVPLVLDGTPEPQEQFLVRLQSPTGGAMLGFLDEVKVYLFDADPSFPITTVSSPSIGEGDAGTKDLEFTVTVTPTTFPVTVKLATVDGTATAGSDYDAKTFALVFQPGDAPKKVAVPVHGDTTQEGNEVFFLNVTELSAGGLEDEGAGEIVDDDDPAVPDTCTGGVELVKPRIVIANLGGAPGDQRIVFRGYLPFAAGNPAGTTPLDSFSRGAQLRIEDLGTGAMLTNLVASSTPIPEGFKSAVCDPAEQDGWLNGTGATRFIYKNRSGELPPACAASSARGLKRLTVRDARAVGGKIKIDGRITGSFGAPAGPVKLTLVLGAAQSYGDSGKCGEHVFPALSCTLNALGTRVTCK
ncbi:hypothetical protein K2Z84_28890 [Candidatus Binatia bacterium]|nr:hypothetical protein [Candidatus Binatia bacterium]